jgi:hypothetical protein
MIDENLRREIGKALEEFAHCVKGMVGDEPEFRALGQILYRLILPEQVRHELEQLQESLSLFTDDPSLPWEILHDGTDFLSLRYPLSRQLILQERLRTLLGPAARSDSGGAALVIADPTENLPGARKEGRAVFEFFRDNGSSESVLLSGRAATWTSIQRHLIERRLAVIHYCGHIDHDATTGEPMMRLHGGSRLSADAVLQQFRGTPIVFLNACYSDAPAELREPSARLTETFAQAFMLGNQEGVASAVVGSMWSIPDEPEEAGTEFALAFYRSLRRCTPIAEALRTARLLTRNEKKCGPMVWGPYVLYGDPNLIPFQPQETGPAMDAGRAKGASRAQAGVRPTDAVTSRGEENPATVTGGSENRDLAEPKRKESKEPAPEAGAAAHKPPSPQFSIGDSLRHVIRLALRECAQMKQPGIGTMHLLIGLCGAGDSAPALRAALLEKGIDAGKVTESAREVALRLIGTSEQGMGISPNALMVIQIAILRAQMSASRSVTADDLLGALLDWGEGTALDVLARQGLAAADLAPRVPQIRIGALSRDVCTPEVWRVLMMALLKAAGRPLDSAALLRAMLRAPDGATEKAFRRLGIDADAVRAALRHMSAEE